MLPYWEKVCSIWSLITTFLGEISSLKTNVLKFWSTDLQQLKKYCHLSDNSFSTRWTMNLSVFIERCFLTLHVKLPQADNLAVCEWEAQPFSSSLKTDQGHETQGDSLQQKQVPGSIGKLEDDLVLQIIDLAQPAVIGYVVTIHEGLWRKQ